MAVLFLPGYRSLAQGAKAAALAEHCRARERPFRAVEYTHGLDERRGTVGLWLGDALDALDALGANRVVIVGASMGAWIAMLVARHRPDAVAGIVGVGAAVDFTERIVRPKIRDDTPQDVYYLPSAYDPSGRYPYAATMLDEARGHLLFPDGGLDAVRCPVRLLHGLGDVDVPWSESVAVAQRLGSSDVRVELIKDGQHRLSSTSAHLRLLCDAVESC